MAGIDRSPIHLFEDLPEEQQYRFAVLKMLETFEATISHATNRKDEAALMAIQSEVASILKSASECIGCGVPYIREIE